MDEEILLKAIKFRFTKTFSEDCYMMQSSNVEIKDVSYIFANEVYLEFTTKILGQEKIQSYFVSVEIPRNWWQHLLQDVFKVKNVRTKSVLRKITFNHYVLLPDLKIDRPDAKTQIRWTQAPTEPGIESASKLTS